MDGCLGVEIGGDTFTRVFYDGAANERSRHSFTPSLPMPPRRRRESEPSRP